jgi:hypothetical protein
VLELRRIVLDAITRATASLDETADEAAFETALATTLGSCERELRASFAPPTLPARRPPQSAIDELAAKNPARRLPHAGIDPCAPRAKLDILWRSPVGPVPIELKFCSKWKADTNGYQFLKDLHRLERMTAAGPHSLLADTRFAAFVTREPVYWRGERPEPKPFWLANGRRINPGYWVQYDQKSADTLWLSYPPFFLANAYQFTWHELRPEWKCLLVEVQPQSLTVPNISSVPPLSNEWLNLLRQLDPTVRWP